MSSGFITETEIADIRKRRQEEWERVRKAEDPIERPEEPYDGRSLYEKLQEQKQKKDLEYEEAHKLKNMIKGLDDDEIEFLDLVDRTKLEADRKKEIEEEIELKDYRNRVALLQEKSLEERLQAEKSSGKPRSSIVQKNSQQKLFKGVIVKKRKTSEDDEKEPNCKETKIENKSNDVMRCVAILPGLGNYDVSSSDGASSDSDIETSQSKMDLLGRKIIKKDAQSSNN